MTSSDIKNKQSKGPKTIHKTRRKIEVSSFTIPFVAKELEKLVEDAIDSVSDQVGSLSQETQDRIYLACIHLVLHLAERYFILGFTESDAKDYCSQLSHFMAQDVYHRLFNIDIVSSNASEYFSTYFLSNYQIISQKLALFPMPNRKQNTDQLPQLFKAFSDWLESTIETGSLVKTLTRTIWDNWPDLIIITT